MGRFRQTLVIKEGRRRYGAQIRFNGESDADWVYRGISTMFETATTDPTNQGSDRSSAWATHLAVLIDCLSIPPMSFYIDEFRANFVG